MVAVPNAPDLLGVGLSANIENGLLSKFTDLITRVENMLKQQSLLFDLQAVLTSLALSITALKEVEWHFQCV